MRSEIITITPGRAAIWLKSNHGNRPVSNVVVDKYATDMRCGKWELTGQGIIFNRSGELVDGQHRLMAVIKAGIPVNMLVIFGEPDNVIMHDRGRGRTLFNVMEMAGYSRNVANSKTIGAVRALYTFTGKALNTKQVSDQTVIDFLKDNAELMSQACSIVGEGVARKSGTIAGVFCALYCGCDRDKLAQFFDVCRSGISGDQSMIPALILRKTFTGEAMNITKMRGSEAHAAYLSTTIQALADYFAYKSRRKVYGVDYKNKPYYQRVLDELIPQYKEKED